MNDKISRFCEDVFVMAHTHDLAPEELVKAASGMMYAFGSKIEDRATARKTIKHWALMAVAIVNGEEKDEKDDVQSN